MASLEQLSIQIGLDPASVKAFLAQTAKVKAQAGAEPVTIQVVSNAGVALASIATAGAAAQASLSAATAQMSRGLLQVGTAAGSLVKELTSIKGALIGLAGFVAFKGAVEESRNLARANVILQFSVEELADAQRELRAVASQTNISYGEISATLFDVASAGFAGKEALDAVSAAALAAAPAGIEVGVAFNAIATAQANFAVTSAQAADILVRTSDVTRGTLADVSNALGRIGPVAGQFGISLEEVGGAFATITQKGVEGAEATTQLFNVINTFLAPADDARDKLQQLGIATGEAAFESQTLAEKMAILKTRAGEIGGLGEIFNIRGFRGAAALSSSIETLGDNISKIQDSSGRAKKGLEDFLASGGPQFDRLVTQIGQLLTAIGTEFLDALAPAIVIFANFIESNKDLLSVLGAVGLSLAVAAASLFAFRGALFAVRTATQLLVGGFNIVSGLLGLQSGLLTANTRAWLANALARVRVIAVAIIAFFTRTVAGLALENKGLLANIAAWARNAVARAATIIEGIIVFFGRIIASLITEATLLNTSTGAWATNTAVKKSAVTTEIALQGALRGSAAGILSVGGALGVAGAALAGFAIGSALDSFFGLSEASGKVASGMEATTGEIIKANIATLGLVNIYSSASAAILKASRSLTEFQKTQIKNNKGVRQTFDFLKDVTDGRVDDQRLANAALGNLDAQLAILKGITGENAKRADVILRIANIENIIAQRNKEQLSTLTKLQQIVKGQINLQTVLNTGAKDFASISAKANAEFAKNNLGATLASALPVVKQFEKDITALTQRSAALNRALGAAKLDLFNDRRRRSGGTKTEEELEGLRQVVVDSAEKIREANEVVAKVFENSRKKLNDIGKRRTAEAVANDAKLTAALEKSKDAQIKIEQDRVAAILTEINKLKSAREGAIKNVQRFIDQLNLAEVRRRDTALAAISELEQRFQTVLKDGLSEGQRAAALGALTKELQRLAAQSDTEINARKELIKVERELAAIRSGAEASGSEDSNVAKQAELQTTIAEEVEKRSAREKEIEGVLERQTTNAEKAAAAFLLSQQTQKALEADRKLILLGVEEIEKRTLQLKKDQTAELEKQKTAIAQFTKLQLAALEAGRKLQSTANIEARSEGRGGFGVSGADTGQRQQALRQAVSDAATVNGQLTATVEKINLNTDVIKADLQARTAATKGFAAELLELTSTVGDEIKNINGEIVIPTVEAMKTELAQLREGFTPLSTSLQGLLAETSASSAASAGFAAESTATLDAASREVAANAQAIGRQTGELATIKQRLDQAASLRAGGLD